MEDYMKGTNAELLGAGQIKGRAAFDLYCRQPGTRIARIMDAIEAGMDCLSLGVTYGVDFETAMVCMKAYRSYYGAPAKKRDETAMSGIETALTSDELKRRGEERKTEEQACQSYDMIGLGTERLSLEERRCEPARRSTANNGVESEMNRFDQISNGKAKKGDALSRRCDERQAPQRRGVELLSKEFEMNSEVLNCKEPAARRTDLSGRGEATNRNEPKRRSKELNGIGIAEDCAELNRQRIASTAREMIGTAKALKSVEMFTFESNQQSREPNCAETNLNCDAIVCEQENRQSRERSGVVMPWQSDANHSEEKNRSGDEPIGLGQQWQSAESSRAEKALICDEPNRIISEPGNMAQIPDLTECVRVMLANGAGVSRIAKRLGVTRTQVTMIVAKIERGK